MTQATGLQAPQSLLTPTRLLFIVAGHECAELQAKLARLDQNLNSLAESDSEPHALISLMSETIRQYQAEASSTLGSANSQPKQVIVLQGASVSAVQQEISAISNALPKVIAEHSHYKTPAGSCFSPSPNSRGGVAFVYPASALSTLHVPRISSIFPGALRSP